MSQVFRKTVPIDIVYELLEKVCDSTLSDNYYIFTLSSYKKLSYYGDDAEFLLKLAPYYHASKVFYVEREHTYKTFCTVLRQICKINNIGITTKMNYSNSSYYIDYYIERKTKTDSSV